MLNLTDFLLLFVDLIMIDLLLFLKLSDMLFCKALELAWDFFVHEVIADWWIMHDNDEWDLYLIDSDNSNDSDLIFMILTNLTHCQQFWWSEFNKSDDSSEKMLELCKRASFNSYDLLCTKILAQRKRKEKEIQIWSFKALWTHIVCQSCDWFQYNLLSMWSSQCKSRISYKNNERLFVQFKKLLLYLKLCF